VGEDRRLQFEQRAYEHFRSEMDDLEKVQALMGEKETGEIEQYREPLSFDEKREITILLSWGGPSDGYKIYFDKENQAIEGSYFFADWFEYEEFKLTDEELDRVIAVYPVSPE
jgi:hypothetical protein